MAAYAERGSSCDLCAATEGGCCNDLGCPRFIDLKVSSSRSLGSTVAIAVAIARAVDSASSTAGGEGAPSNAAAVAAPSAASAVSPPAAALSTAPASDAAVPSSEGGEGAPSNAAAVAAPTAAPAVSPLSAVFTPLPPSVSDAHPYSPSELRSRAVGVRFTSRASASVASVVARARSAVMRLIKGAASAVAAAAAAAGRSVRPHRAPAHSDGVVSGAPTCSAVSPTATSDERVDHVVSATQALATDVCCHGGAAITGKLGLRSAVPASTSAAGRQLGGHHGGQRRRQRARAAAAVQRASALLGVPAAGAGRSVKSWVLVVWRTVRRRAAAAAAGAVLRVGAPKLDQFPRLRFSRHDGPPTRRPLGTRVVLLGVGVVRASVGAVASLGRAAVRIIGRAVGVRGTALEHQHGCKSPAHFHGGSAATTAAAAAVAAAAVLATAATTRVGRPHETAPVTQFEDSSALDAANATAAAVCRVTAAATACRVASAAVSTAVAAIGSAISQATNTPALQPALAPGSALPLETLVRTLGVEHAHTPTAVSPSVAPPERGLTEAQVTCVLGAYDECTRILQQTDRAASQDMAAATGHTSFSLPLIAQLALDAAVSRLASLPDVATCAAAELETHTAAATGLLAISDALRGGFAQVSFLLESRSHVAVWLTQLTLVQPRDVDIMLQKGCWGLSSSALAQEVRNLAKDMHRNSEPGSRVPPPSTMITAAALVM